MVQICSDFKLLVRRQYSTNKKNLVIYCTFAFGLPLILCIITIVMQVHILEENSLYNPNFGKTNCFFELHNRIPRMLYFDIPMGILFTVNLVVLAVALKNISQFTKTYQEQSKATTTNSSLPPKNEGIASLKNILENFLDRCRSKLSKNNSGKSETEESASNNEDDTTKEGNDEESSSSEGKELQSLATLSSSLESLSNINQNTRNDTAMDSSEAKVEKVYDSENVDHKLEKPARRQTTSGMRKYAKKDFTVEFWHKVFIFTLMIVCWATEVASAFIKPDEIWAVTDILNTFQGSFQFVLLLRNNFKRDLCSNKYPALFNMIDALESVLKSCFSGLKSCLCHMCKR
ncbi:uncharacterized protein LOC143032197 [Oratosquilla oratoria]|uniref:uncharacterized protein LOC143032197 n=1 Tax=Oratosquilla oratoria TaxID=337810 RepID=UPI003F76CAE8